MRRTPIVLALCLIGSCLYAQNEFGPGYILKNSRDTVRGFVEKTMTEALNSKVNFKTTPDAAVQSFMPKELFGFGLEKDHYRTMTYNNVSLDVPAEETSFVKLLVTGRHELYTLLRDDRRFYILKTDTQSLFLFNTEYSSRAEYQKTGNYSSRLVLLQSECEKKVMHSESVSYGQKEMSRYIFDLNNCAQPGSSQMFYNPYKLKTEVLIMGGGIPWGNEHEYFAEAQLRFSSPSISKNTFLDAGVRYVNLVTAYMPAARFYGDTPRLVSTTHQIFSIPLLVQYYFLTGRIRPYFYGGFSASFLNEQNDDMYNGYPGNDDGTQKSFGVAFIIGAGIDVKIVNRLYIRADYRYERVSQLPVLGLVYQIK